MSCSPEASIRKLAARQYGLFTADDLAAAGLDRHVTTRRLRVGTWEQVHRGVYRFSGHPSPYRHHLLAAVLFNGAGAVASHRAAACMWAFPGFSRDPVVEVSKPRGRNQRRRGIWEHGSLWLPPHHVTMLDSIPVTTAARTIFDLAGTVHPKRAERALENALSKGIATHRSLGAVFDDLARRGRRGTVLMRDLLEARGEGYVASNSELEALGRRVLRDGGLLHAEFEVDLGVEAGWVGRVDLVYRDGRVVVELDSRRHHTALRDRESDRKRDNQLMADGWRVLRFTWEDLVDRPYEVVAEVRRALSEPVVVCRS